MCHFSALRIQHIREMPGQNRSPQSLNTQRVEIAASLKIGARRLIKRNQMARVVVHAHDRAASRQQRGGHVPSPLGEPVLKLRNELLHRLRRNAAFAGQDPQPIGLGAAFFQRIRHPVQRILKRPEDLGQQTAGQSRPGLPHGQQEIGGIGRDQHVGLPPGQRDTPRQFSADWMPCTASSMRSRASLRAASGALPASASSSGRFMSSA